MTPDEVVAHNLKQIIKDDRDISVEFLARRLSISEDKVRDMTRPRKGYEQRAFLWIDLIQLCIALNRSLFELVLPPENDPVTGEVRPREDVTVTGHKGEVPSDATGVRWKILTDLTTSDRNQFAREVFGLPLGTLTPEELTTLIGLIVRERESHRAEIEKELDKTARAAREFVEAIESLERHVIEGARIHEEALRAEEE